MTMIRTINDVESVYDRGLIHTEDGTFACPMCGKSYKRLNMAEKHLNQRDCHTVKDMFMNTVYEKDAFGLYNEIVSIRNRKAVVNINVFRKSSMYKNCVKFIVFCSHHEVKDFGLYFMWLRDIKEIRSEAAVLKYAQEETNLREFRVFLQQHDKIDSRRFFDRFKEELEKDDHFLVRSIEKAHLGVKFLHDHHHDWLYGKFESLPIDYRTRIMDMV